MYKVLIVDDEKLIRIALKTIIKWQENGFLLVGEAKDGREALKIASEKEPDIIVTDLKMPDVDGIQLIRELKDAGYNGKIMVLSNYGDYELVREAMKLGASDYLMKISLKPDEFINCLKQMAEKKDLETRKSEEEAKTRLELSEKRDLVRRNFFKELLEGDDITAENALQYAENLDMAIKEPCILLYLHIDHADFLSPRNKSIDKSYLLFSIHNIISESLHGMKGVEISETSPRSFAVVLPFNNDMELIRTKSKDIMESMRMYLHIPVSIVISHSFMDLTSLRKTYMACRHTMNMKFYTGNSSIFVQDETSFSNEPLPEFTELIKKIKHLPEEGETGEIINSMSSIKEKAGQIRMDPDILKKMLFFIVDDLVLTLISMGGGERFKSLEYRVALHDSEFVEKYFDELSRLLSDIFQEFKQLKRKVYRKEIETVMVYIREHIGDKITLGRIAEKVNMNESYLCRIFKQETGKNLVNHINELKMEKAKKLLLDSDLIIKEVAAEVGIDDAFYFNRIFNKYMGVSPSEYKKKFMA